MVEANTAWLLNGKFSIKANQKLDNTYPRD